MKYSLLNISFFLCLKSCQDYSLRKVTPKRSLDLRISIFSQNSFSWTAMLIHNHPINAWSLLYVLFQIVNWSDLEGRLPDFLRRRGQLACSISNHKIPQTIIMKKAFFQFLLEGSSQSSQEDLSSDLHLNQEKDKPKSKTFLKFGYPWSISISFLGWEKSSTKRRYIK